MNYPNKNAKPLSLGGQVQSKASATPTAQATPVPKPTLEQQRAQRAWDDALRAQKGLGKDEYDKYVNLTKSLPALIMNSGLMPVMAFCHEKSLDKKTGQPKITDRHTWVAGQLRAALHQQFKEFPEEFHGFMKSLMSANPSTYQAVVSEAFLVLRWMRQMAAALPAKKEGA